MPNSVAPTHETLSFVLTLLGFSLVGLGIMIHKDRVRRAGGGLLLGVGSAGITIAWDRWSARTGKHMSVRALRHGRKQPLNAEEKRALQAHIGQLIAGAVALW